MTFASPVLEIRQFIVGIFSEDFTFKWFKFILPLCYGCSIPGVLWKEKAEGPRLSRFTPAYLPQDMDGTSLVARSGLDMETQHSTNIQEFEASTKSFGPTIITYTVLNGGTETSEREIEEVHFVQQTNQQVRFISSELRDSCCIVNSERDDCIFSNDNSPSNRDQIQQQPQQQEQHKEQYYTLNSSNWNNYVNNGNINQVESKYWNSEIAISSCQEQQVTYSVYNNTNATTMPVKQEQEQEPRETCSIGTPNRSPAVPDALQANMVVPGMSTNSIS